MADRQRTARQERVLTDGETQSRRGQRRPVYRTFNALTDFSEQRNVGRLTRTQQLASERALKDLENANPATDAQSLHNEQLRKAMAFQEKFANAMAGEDAWRQFIWDNYDLYGKFFPPSREEIVKALNSGLPFSQYFGDASVARNLARFESDCQMVRTALTQEGVGSSERTASPADFISSISGVSTHGEALITVDENAKTAREYIQDVYFKSDEYQEQLGLYRQQLNARRRQVRNDAKAKKQEIADIDASISQKRQERDDITLRLSRIPEPFGQGYKDREASRVSEIYQSEGDIEKLEADKKANKTSFADERKRIMTSKSGAELSQALLELDARRQKSDADFDKKINSKKTRIEQLKRDSENDKDKQTKNQENINELINRRNSVNSEIADINATKATADAELDALTQEDAQLTSTLSPKATTNFQELYNDEFAYENSEMVNILLKEADLDGVADEKILLRDGKLFVLPPSASAGDRISVDFLLTPEELSAPFPQLTAGNMTVEERQKEDEMFANFQNSVRAEVSFDSRTRRQAARGQNFIYHKGKMRANYSAMSGTDAVVQSIYGITRVANKLTDNKAMQEIARLKATEFIMRGVDLGDPAKNQAICANLQMQVQKRLMYLNPNQMRSGLFNNAVNWVNDRSAEIAHQSLVEMGYDPALTPATHAKNGFEYQARTTAGEIRFSEFVNTPVNTIAPQTLTEETVNGIAKPRIAAIDAMSISKVLYLANMEGVPAAQAKWSNAITPEKLDVAFRRDGCKKLAGLMNKQLQQLQPYVRKGRKGKKFNEKEKRIVSDAVGQIIAIIKNDPNQYILKQLDSDLIYNIFEVSPEELQNTTVAIANEAGAAEAINQAENANAMATGTEEVETTPEEITGENDEVRQASMFDPDINLIRKGELGKGELTDIVVNEPTRQPNRRVSNATNANSGASV